MCSAAACCWHETFFLFRLSSCSPGSHVVNACDNIKCHVNPLYTHNNLLVLRPHRGRLVRAPSVPRKNGGWSREWMLCNHANMTAARLGGVAVRSLPVGARGPRAVAFLSLPFPFDCSDAKVHYILSLLYCLAYIQIQRAKLHATPGESTKRTGNTPTTRTSTAAPATP